MALLRAEPLVERCSFGRLSLSLFISPLGGAPASGRCTVAPLSVISVFVYSELSFVLNYCRYGGSSRRILYVSVFGGGGVSAARWRGTTRNVL